MSERSKKPQESSNFNSVKRPSLPQPLQIFKRSLSAKTNEPPPPEKSPVKRPIIKRDLPSIDKVTSAEGEVFLIGDKVLITELGRKSRGAIKIFYADAGGDIWAQVVPVESDHLCLWQQACIQSKFLVRDTSI